MERKPKKPYRTPCYKCGGYPKIYGSDYLNTEGPWHVECEDCHFETDIWAHKFQAWKQWVAFNMVED